jgi:hypothetical protein
MDDHSILRKAHFQTPEATDTSAKHKERERVTYEPHFPSHESNEYQ